MSAYTEEEQEQIKVRSANSMNIDFFRKHMEARHATQVGKFKFMDWGDSEYLEACWRAYHDAIHNYNLQPHLDHYHGH